ncbi:MAG: c-type cytochrome [Anaerolineae bacterium]|nr:c-type cytochrome [Anaerolineae bacterium]
MTMIKNRLLLLLWIIGLVGLLAGCGLSSEPEILQEIPLPTSAPALALPETMPDLAAGAVFYTEHCAMCHGAGGQGDGTMVQDGRLQNPPPDFSDPALVVNQTPFGYMQAITEGNMISGMPPFSRYTAEERWNVTAYVYTGAIAPDTLALGAAVYEANCASCHGDGTGNGPDAPEIMPDLTAFDFWAENSNAAIASKISTGVMPGMPGFADSLTAAEIDAAALYLRTLALAGTPGFPTAAETAGETVMESQPESTSQPEATAVAEAAAPEDGEAASASIETPDMITVTGQVTNGTTGGGIPEGVDVTLHMFDPPAFTETTLTGTLAADGTYLFADVPYVADRVYLLSLEYDDVFFSTTVYEVTDLSDPTLDTTLEIFETTDDPAVLTYDAGVMRVTFSHFGMEVAEVLSVSNASDRLYLTDEYLDENQRIALRIPLPPGAGGVGFEAGMQGTRFFTNADESVVFDTQPVRPGRTDVFFSYFIPYEDGAIIEQELTYPFAGPFHLLIEAAQVEVTGDFLTSAGERVDMGGSAFDAFVAQLDLVAGETLTFTLSGTPDAVSALQESEQPVSEGLPPLVIILVVAGIVLVGAAGFMFLLRQGAGQDHELDARINDLLEEIAALDNQHDQGDINHDVYQRARAKLKAELAELMQAEDDSREEPGA